MKQLMIKKGTVVIEEVPTQLNNSNSVKVEVAYSFISPGTEIAGLNRSGQSLIKRAVKQPANIRKFINMALTKGVASTVGDVKSKSSMGATSGYSLAGTVIETGNDIEGISVGDPIACAGAGIATHSEIVVVPKNLAVLVPDECSLRAASSVAIGAIAMQGVRRAAPQVGENVAVIGLGLIGQITVQILLAAGCHVIGIDLDKRRLALATDQGIEKGFPGLDETALKNIFLSTGGIGADSTIICAASKSNEIIQHAMEITRKKGKVIIVGDVGLGVLRKPFYEKEIDLLISCSYGPGRYDNKFEIDGFDYPKAYVRWTEKDNMHEYLKLIAKKKINIESLIERTYSLDRAAEAYAELTRDGNKPLGVVLEYQGDESVKRKQISKIDITATEKKGRVSLAVIGAGSFANSVHLPNIAALSELFSLRALGGRTGTTIKNLAKKYSPGFITTDYDEILKDEEIDAVMICTRHNLHASMAIKALESGKAVFLEKPMAMNMDELQSVIDSYGHLSPRPPFLVGFNRRFSPAAVKAKEIIDSNTGPIMVLYRVRANPVPPDHWVQTSEGGGRVLGEACHMIDLFKYFTGSTVISIDAEAITPGATGLLASDNFVATIKYAEGSVCTLVYTTQGSPKTNKEYIEIFINNQTLIIDDFKRLNILGAPQKNWANKSSDKGHMAELMAFAKSFQQESGNTIPFNDLIETTEATFTIRKMLKS